MTQKDHFLTKGWVKFGYEEPLHRWISTAKAPALATAKDPEFAHWHRHQNTWFVGVNALKNDVIGRVENGPPLECGALDLTRELYGECDLDPAQVSIIYPGYPRRDVDESEANHRFRLRRDAGHVDGLNAVGPDRRRFLNEPHAYILGLPLSETANSPLVVWEKSDEVVREAFLEVFGGLSDEEAAKLDITSVYKEARRRVFDSCKRVELPAKAGEATLVHRLAVHGVAPWSDNADFEPRAILYFRPVMSGGAKDWLSQP